MTEFRVKVLDKGMKWIITDKGVSIIFITSRLKNQNG